jgi:hypothetical protein
VTIEIVVREKFETPIAGNPAVLAVANDTESKAEQTGINRVMAAAWRRLAGITYLR